MRLFLIFLLACGFAIDVLEYQTEAKNSSTHPHYIASKELSHSE